MGSVLISLNDLPGALEVFQKSLPLREKLAALDPADARTKMNLCHSHESIGWVLVRLARAGGGRAFPQATGSGAATGGQGHVRIEYQRALAGAYENLGSVFEQKGNCRAGWCRLRGEPLRVFDALRARKALSAEYTQTPARLQKAIAGCKV